MSELFTNYEQDYMKSMASTKKKLADIKTLPLQKQDKAYKDVRAELSEVERALKYLEAECGSFAAKVRSRYQQKIVDKKRQYQQLKKTIAQQEQSTRFELNKDLLLDDMNSDNNVGNEKLIKQGEVLSDNTYKLKRSLKEMRETEEMSDGIQLQLSSQTERLQKNRNKMVAINTDLSESQLLIRKIGSMMRRNKLIIGAVVGTILLTLILVLILKLS